MKNIASLFIAGLFFIGITACEKVNKEEETKGGNDATGAVNNSNNAHDQGANGATNDLPLTTVQWAETTHDYGKIPSADSVKHVFKFTNTGKEPLQITEVKPACGCTKGKYTTESVPPGGEGFVELKFGPQGKEGVQNKNATVVMNTEPKAHTLSFQAEVMK